MGNISTWYSIGKRLETFGWHEQIADKHRDRGHLTDALLATRFMLMNSLRYEAQLSCRL